MSSVQRVYVLPAVSIILVGVYSVETVRGHMWSSNFRALRCHPKRNGSSTLHCSLENSNLHVSRDLKIDANNKKYVLAVYTIYCLSAFIRLVKLLVCVFTVYCVSFVGFYLCVKRSVGTILQMVCSNASFSLLKHNFANLRHEHDLLWRPDASSMN